MAGASAADMPSNIADGSPPPWSYAYFFEGAGDRRCRWSDLCSDGSDVCDGSKSVIRDVRSTPSRAADSMPAAGQGRGKRPMRRGGRGRPRPEPVAPKAGCAGTREPITVSNSRGSFPGVLAPEEDTKALENKAMTMLLEDMLLEEKAVLLEDMLKEFETRAAGHEAQREAQREAESEAANLWREAAAMQHEDRLAEARRMWESAASARAEAEAQAEEQRAASATLAEEMQRANIRLQRENGRLQRENGNSQLAQAECNRLREQLRLTQEESKASPPNDRLEELESLRIEIKELKAHHNKQVQDLEVRARRPEKRVRDLAAETRQARAELEAMTSKYEQTRELNVRLGREVQQARRDKAESAKEVERLEREFQRLRRETALTEELRTARQDIAMAKERRVKSLEEEIGRQLRQNAVLCEAEQSAKRNARRWQERVKDLSWQAQRSEENAEEARVLIKQLEVKERRASEDRDGLMGTLVFRQWCRKAQADPDGEEYSNDTRDLRARLRRVARDKNVLLGQNTFLEWKLQIAMSQPLLKRLAQIQRFSKSSSLDQDAESTTADESLSRSPTPKVSGVGIDSDATEFMAEEDLMSFLPTLEA